MLCCSINIILSLCFQHIDNIIIKFVLFDGIYTVIHITVYIHVQCYISLFLYNKEFIVYNKEFIVYNKEFIIFAYNENKFLFVECVNPPGKSFSKKIFFEKFLFSRKVLEIL